MEDKYNLTRQECIELAKRNIVDNIYSSAKIEGIAVTFPQTMEIFEGRTVAGMSIDDTNKINNMKHAWQFLFDSIDYPLDFLYLRQLNKIVNQFLMSDAGMLRNYDVRIGGTSWKPDMPDEDAIKQDIAEIMNMECVTAKAVSIMLYVMRAQIFSDGNKRVAQLAANQILIQNSKGYLRIPPELKEHFFELLIKYYESGNGDTIGAFICDKCIEGKTVARELVQEPLNEDMFITNKDRGGRL